MLLEKYKRWLPWYLWITVLAYSFAMYLVQLMWLCRYSVKALKDSSSQKTNTGRLVQINFSVHEMLPCDCFVTCYIVTDGTKRQFHGFELLIRPNVLFSCGHDKLVIYYIDTYIHMYICRWVGLVK